jgi:hypothetical protein
MFAVTGTVGINDKFSVKITELCWQPHMSRTQCRGAALSAIIFRFFSCNYARVKRQSCSLAL